MHIDFDGKTPFPKYRDASAAQVLYPLLVVLLTVAEQRPRWCRFLKTQFLARLTKERIKCNTTFKICSQCLNLEHGFQVLTANPGYLGR